MEHGFDTGKFTPLATIEDLSHPFDSFKVNNFDLVKGPESSQVDSRLQLLYPKVNGKFLYYQEKLGGDIAAQQDLTQIKQGIQSEFLGLHRSNEANALFKKENYDLKLKECFGPDCKSFDELHAELNKKPILSREEFEKKIREMDGPLEVPLIDHVDIILFLASITEVVLNLGIKGGKFILNKTGECLLKTETGTQLVKLKDGGLQVIQRLVENSKEGIKLLKPKEFAVTPNGVMMEVGGDVAETGIAKTVSKSEMVGEGVKAEGKVGESGKIDFSTTKNSVLTNNYNFIRDFGTMEPQEFSKRVFIFADDLRLEHFTDKEIIRQSFQVLTGIKDYVTTNAEILKRPLSEKIKKDILIDLGVVRDKINKLMTSKQIENDIKVEIREALEGILEAKKLLN